MKKPPCEKCPKKGCGAYHDVCPDYLEWAKNEKINRTETMVVTGAKPHMERSKSFRRSKNNIVLQDRRK